MANSILNCHRGEKSTWLAFTDEERDVARRGRTTSRSSSMGAHPFLTLTLFIAMFERDHGPLGVPDRLRPGAQAPVAALPRHRHLTCAVDAAAVLHTPGSPPSYGEHPAPAAAAGSTLVRVTAAPVVPLDLLCASRHVVLRGARDAVRAGRSGRRRRSRRRTPAPRLAGVVLRDGRDEARRREHGRAAAWCRTPTSCRIAEDVPDAMAAALGLSGVAAWMALSWRARLEHGERVLVLGGGGAVGQAGIGAAHVLGASTVVAVARPASVDRASAAGRRRRRPARSLTSTPSTAALAEHGPFDVVLDPVFGPSATAAARVLGPGRSAGQPRRRRRATRRPSRRPDCAAAARRCSATRTTRSAPSSGPRPSRPSSAMPPRDASGCSTTECPLADVEEVWRRETTGDSGVRCVLLPSTPKVE